MRACVVHSQDVDSVDAVAELVAVAKVALGASLPRVAMLFAGIDHTTQLIQDIAASSTKKTAKCAAIGAGASALKKGDSAGNAAGALVEFKLAAPLTVTVK